MSGFNWGLAMSVAAGVLLAGLIGGVVARAL